MGLTKIDVCSFGQIRTDETSLEQVSTDVFRRLKSDHKCVPMRFTVFLDHVFILKT